MKTEEPGGDVTYVSELEIKDMQSVSAFLNTYSSSWIRYLDSYNPFSFH